MTARANIAQNDGEGTPVTHTFVPDGDIAEGVARWVNRNASVPAASEKITLMVKDSPSQPEEYSTPGKKVSPRVTEYRLRMPVTYVDGVSGLTLIDYTNEVIVRFNLHPRTSEQAAKNLRTLTLNSLGANSGNQIAYAVDKGEKIW